MDSEKFKSYNILDFCKDRMFIDWVLRPEENDGKFWEFFLAEHPQKKEDIERARRLILNSKELMADESFTSGETEELREGIILGIKELAEKRRKIPRNLSQWSKWAAAIVCLLAFAGGMYFTNKSPELLSYRSSFGEIKSLLLPDSSTVKLHPNSSLQFSSAWEKGADREVWLQGEAYFEVEKKLTSGAKFLVHTPDLNVEVLGTEFNVNTRKDQTEVVLNEGKIKLKLEDQNKESILMEPGDLISYSKKKDHLAQKKIDPKARISWKEGIQQFDKEPLFKVIDGIEEIYGINIDAAGAELDKIVVVGIPMENKDIALATLESILGKSLTPISDKDYVTN